MKNWIVTFIIVVTIVFAFSGIMFFREIRATVKSNKVKVGDTFMIKVNSRNPYDENYLIKRENHRQMWELCFVCQ